LFYCLYSNVTGAYDATMAVVKRSGFPAELRVFLALEF